MASNPEITGLPVLLRFTAAYAEDLIERPPVRSLSPDENPDPLVRKRIAQGLTQKDVTRVQRVLAAAGLEIVRTEAKQGVVMRLRSAESRLTVVEARHFALLADFQSLFDATRDAIIAPSDERAAKEEALHALVQSFYDNCPFVPKLESVPGSPVDSQENINSPCL